jgi:iron complex transport system substrate-binding protein
MAACVCSAALAIEVLDDRGHSVDLDRPAQRVVTLAPHLAELIYAAGGGDRLVGASEYSDFPAAAASVPRVGGAAGIDVERVLALHPDLVAAWGSGNDPRTVRQLERLGIPVYVAEAVRPEDVARHLRDLGRLMAAPAAEHAARDFELRLEALRRRYRGRAELTVFVEIEQEPLMTVGGRHIITGLVHLCGGRNVFAALHGLTPTVDQEAVLQVNPDIILAVGPGALAWLGEWRRWPELKAVQRGGLVSVPEDWLARPGPRLILGAERLCQVIDSARASSRTSALARAAEKRSTTGPRRAQGARSGASAGIPATRRSATAP